MAVNMEKEGILKQMEKLEEAFGRTARDLNGQITPLNHLLIVIIAITIINNSNNIMKPKVKEVMQVEVVKTIIAIEAFHPYLRIMRNENKGFIKL